MGTTAMISQEEYLRTSYEHDCEWIEGEVRERAMPDEYHSALQQFFLMYFQNLKRELHVRVRPELRVRVAARRYRIPDVTILAESAPFQAIPDTPPVLCIEVLSPDDRPGELEEKIDDYVAMGVGAIWIVDPRRRKLWTADTAGMHAADSFQVPNSALILPAAEIFAELDSLTEQNPWPLTPA
jgi:Uma2 family endonuclease